MKNALLIITENNYKLKDVEEKIMKIYNDAWESDNERYKKTCKENEEFFKSLTNEEKLLLMWKEFESNHYNECGYASAMRCVKEEAKNMTKLKRTDVLLFNAIDLLLKKGCTREEIMKELGMTKEESETLRDEV